ncbi:alternative sulfate transporter [Sodiomyces alkalinus F11]|uniref:Alternative sulfate transporter n=1 Tax=Sodiomyces alkalinus (strain CBS 110278 / VKM F-3762 / F11) TaxID=1314773 RepID=A0A3N2PKW8_SODAK|nr:alternative sulfate transporter [Sodiomyces alkalinus F11]ROT35139.1 alternative sulfate transporter [Sodiomyces alkalinus F11]
MSEKVLEKEVVGAVDNVAPTPDTGSDIDQIEWTAEEEKRLVRKVGLVVIPLLIMGFFVLQMDRGNIGNALTDFFFRDVGITQNQFNIGQNLMSLGIIPSNLVLYRVGPSLWIGCQIVAWGMVVVFQAFQKGLAAFLVTRLLLGLCESGFIPAALYTITRWYTRNETSKRFSWFFIGNMTANATSGLIAYGILHMRGVQGLAGWQWLFILEGLFTIFVGATFICFFPKSPSEPVSIFGYRYFTEREAQILTARVLRDDPTKAQKNKHMRWKEIKDALTNWKLISHLVLTVAGLAPAATLVSYGPTLVVSFGFGRLRSNALMSIGSWLQLLSNLLMGYVADKWDKRGPVAFVGVLFYMGFAIGNRLLIFSDNAGLRFAFLTLVIPFAVNWHPVNGAWMALNAQSAGERSITMALLIMGANVAAMIGSQLFQQEDGPLYPKGWAGIVALTVASFLAVSVSNWQYWWLNRREAEKGVTETKWKIAAQCQLRGLPWRAR